MLNIYKTKALELFIGLYKMAKFGDRRNEYIWKREQPSSDFLAQ